MFSSAGELSLVRESRTNAQGGLGRCGEGGSLSLRGWVAHLLYAIPAVRNSLRLTICDAIVGVSSGFPQDGVSCTPKRILLAQDPVAMESYLVDLMKQILDTHGRQLDPELLLWLDNAAKLGLGTRGYQLVQV
jgi:hypothetical protein